MFGLLLDENISSVVAMQAASRRPEIVIESIFHWRAGTLTNTPDHLVLQAAAEDSLTLVTYDQRTIPALLMEWAASGIPHAGIVYVDERTIHPEDFGGLIRAIEKLWDTEHHQD
jgi:hypothetical protein